MKKLTYSKLLKAEFEEWSENFPFKTDDKTCYKEGFSDGVWNLMVALKNSKLLSLEEIYTVLYEIDPKGESLSYQILTDWIDEESELYAN